MRLTEAQRRHVERPNPTGAPAESPSSPEGSGDGSRTASAALALVRGGMWVFPCRPRAKEPATRHGFKDARDDARSVERWWSRNPEYNPAIDCGRSSIVVLDADEPDAFEAFCARHRQEVPATFTVETGHGRHYWFNLDPPMSVVF